MWYSRDRGGNLWPIGLTLWWVQDLSLLGSLRVHLKINGPLCRIPLIATNCMHKAKYQYSGSQGMHQDVWWRTDACNILTSTYFTCMCFFSCYIISTIHIFFLNKKNWLLKCSQHQPTLTTLHSSSSSSFWCF